VPDAVAAKWRGEQLVLMLSSTQVSQSKISLRQARFAQL
jgi:hypothetical protein